MAHLNGFTHGPVDHLLAYQTAGLIAVVGTALGLRCTVRALALPRAQRRDWLLLAAAALGCGVWAAQAVAMLGFAPTGANVRYDGPLALLGLAVAVVAAGLGVLWVGYGPQGWAARLVGGVLLGLGVAGTQYLGLAAVHLNGTVGYRPPLVAASVGVAVLASAAALRTALTLRGFWASALSALLAGGGVCAAHYAATRAMTVRLVPGLRPSGGPADRLVLPVVAGVAVFLAVAGLVVALSPREADRRRREAEADLRERIQVVLLDGRTRGL
jgi:NO-binding membrane sensor protein with MHYT domain